jgi:hypothetical protein
VEPGPDDLRFCGRSLMVRRPGARGKALFDENKYKERPLQDAIISFLQNLNRKEFLDDIVEDIFWSWEGFISDVRAQIVRV